MNQPHDNLRDPIEALVAASGADTASIPGKILAEIHHTTTKLAGDGANLGELKLLSRSYKELRYALKVFRRYENRPKIATFGSARTPIDHPDYRCCHEFSRRMAEVDWMTITGAGDGIMRAGNEGATREHSFGVSIRLPFETNANDIIADDDKLITFRYFFTRKLVFLWMSRAVAAFPGGFGTQDEAFEALTLIQTGKAPMMPVVLVDHPDEGDGKGPGDYWKHWLNYIEHSLLANGWISPEDMNLFAYFNDPAAAVAHIQHFYSNYHSERFIRDRHVLRVKHAPDAQQLIELNSEFGDLVKSGEITVSPGPLPAEKDFLPDLARVHFHSRKRAYGRLRLLIDRLNGPAPVEATPAE